MNDDFGSVIRALKGGWRAYRKGWNGKGMWITLSPGGNIPADKFWAPNNKAFAESEPGGCARVAPYITMKTATGEIVPWVASQSDMLAEDWAVLK